MEEVSRGLRRLLELEESRLSSVPLNFYALDSVSSDVTVRLSSGDQKSLLLEDVERLRRELPAYLHAKVKIPIVLTITMNEACRYRLEGDPWQARCVDYLLRRVVTWEPRRCLCQEEVVTLIRSLRSLLHVRLEGAVDEEEG